MVMRIIIALDPQADWRQVVKDLSEAMTVIRVTPPGVNAPGRLIAWIDGSDPDEVIPQVLEIDGVLIVSQDNWNYGQSADLSRCCAR
ncbi:hypothetical protein ABT052_02455 [Streptomyces sp. NPDC002766]|uniref:hypothetical protein n=1 Tax=Streptomyces sp. NPDC002766 TaxID=3154429 RepID=UPI0033209E8E